MDKEYMEILYTIFATVCTSEIFQNKKLIEGIKKAIYSSCKKFRQFGNKAESKSSSPPLPFWSLRNNNYWEFSI